MSNLTKYFYLTAILAGVYSYPVLSIQTSDARSNEDIQEEIERLEILKHEAEARQNLLIAEEQVVEKQLSLARKRQLLKNGGIDPEEEKKKAALKPVVQVAPFRWPELPSIMAYGSDEDGSLVSLQYRDGTRINVREGMVIRDDIKILSISSSGIKLQKGNNTKWIN